VARPKIVFIGAGSGSFTLSQVRALCRTPNLHGSLVSLMDIDEDRLDDTYVICRRVAEQMGVEVTFEKTLDRREALTGADFVISTALVDGARRMKEGWLIAEKHGVKWGGSYHILYDEPFWLNYYQLQLFEGIARDMLDLCHEAWLLLISNPVLAGTTFLTRKYPELKMVGLCGADGSVYEIASVLGLEREHITYEVPGVNHFIWLTKMYHRGQDVFPMIDEWLETEAARHWETHPEGEMGMKKMDLYRKLGAIPIGDSASITGASWPWWYHSSDEVERQWRTDSRQWWYDYLDHVRTAPEEFKRLVEDESHDYAGGAQEPEAHGLQIPIVESIACDIPRTFITNIQNTNEFVAGIPRDFEVEIPTLISRRGVQGIKTDGLPRAILAHLLRDRVAPVEIELEAYEKGSRDLLTHLVMTDKWITSQRQAEDLVEEVFALPYHGELREHYR
jgi:alpha-galactosidase